MVLKRPSDGRVTTLWERGLFLYVAGVGSPMSWAELFERAEAFETTLAEIETALAERRGDGSGNDGR